MLVPQRGWARAGYGDQGHWQEGKDIEELFPYWRRDLWTK